MIAFSLGGNEANSLTWIQEAVRVLKNHLFAPKVSEIYLTNPLGPGTRPFHNLAVVGLSADQTLDDWWNLCQKLEKDSGRDRATEITWGDRVLDIDILFYEKSVVVREDLIVPHPQMHRRPFVLIPLTEIAPRWQHPLLGKNVEELLSDLSQSPDSPGGVCERLGDFNLQDNLI